MPEDPSPAYYPSPVHNTPVRIPPPFPYGYDDSNYLHSNTTRTRQNILNLINATEEPHEFSKSFAGHDGNNCNSLGRSSAFLSENGGGSSLPRSLSSSDRDVGLPPLTYEHGLPVVTGRVSRSRVRSPILSHRRTEPDNRIHTPADYYVTSTVSRNWEYVNVTLTRVPGYGFGIAVSGGCDNPHFANGDPAIAISDVLKGGPAMGKLQINDRIVSANGISLDNVDYSTAVQILRDSGPSVNLRVKRRVNPQSYKVTVPLSTKRLKKLSFDSLGFTVSVTLQIKTVDSPSLGLREGDLIDKIQGLRVNELFNEKVVCKEIRRVLEDQGGGGSTNLNLTVKRTGSNRAVPTQQPQSSTLQQPSHSVGNLYVQPPTRANNKSFDSTNTPLPPPPPPNPPVPPPRPPLPQEFEPVTTHPLRSINFIKQNQLGIRLSGGNKTGIIVSAVQKNSQADLQGLSTNDKIIRVNEHDFLSNPPTREQAIEILSSIPNDTLVNLTVEKLGVPIQMNDNQDEFYVRTRVATDDLKLHEIVVVTDTLVNGLVGQWEAWRLDHQGNKVQKLVIPNMKNGRELLKKSWKRTHSFRNREFEELLHVAPATEPYDIVERRTAELHTRPVILFSPVNGMLIECLMMLKHASRLFKVVRGVDELEFNDGRVRIVSEVISVKGVQELYDKRLFPFVVFANFRDKEELKAACKDSAKYSKAKKLWSVLQKVREKLGSYVDMAIELRDSEGGAEALYEQLAQGRGSVFYAAAPTSPQQQQQQQQNGSSQTTPSKRSQSTPRTPVNKESTLQRPSSSSHHSRHKSQDNLVSTPTQNSSAFRTPTSPSPASMSSLKFPNFNIPPPCSIEQNPIDTVSRDYEKRVNLQRSATTVGGSERSDTRTSHHHPPTTPTNLHNNFAHSPVLEHKNVQLNGHDRIRAQSNPPPQQRQNGVPPPTVDRTKKPSSANANVFYPVNVSTPPSANKPKPPPKPRIIPRDHGNGNVNRSLFRPVSNASTLESRDSNDDSGQTYLNIPMNAKVAQQQFLQQQVQQQTVNLTQGVFDWRGGRLVQKGTYGGQIPIEVFVPERAIPVGESVNIWFQIVDYNIREDAQHAQKKMLSPLVKFGPENYRFQIPVEIRIPQYSASSSEAKVLMSNSNYADHWTKIDIQNGNFESEYNSDVKVVSLTVQQF